MLMIHVISALYVEVPVVWKRWRWQVNPTMDSSRTHAAAEWWIHNVSHVFI